MKTSIYDLLFMSVLALVLLALNQTKNLNYIIKMPFIYFLVVYYIGRFVGRRNSKTGHKKS